MESSYPDPFEMVNPLTMQFFSTHRHTWGWSLNIILFVHDPSSLFSPSNKKRGNGSWTLVNFVPTSDGNLESVIYINIILKERLWYEHYVNNSKKIYCICNKIYNWIECFYLSTLLSYYLWYPFSPLINNFGSLFFISRPSSIVQMFPVF